MATPNHSGVEAIQMARKFQYTGVDLRISDHLGELKINSSAEEINQIKDAFKSEGVKPSGLLCYNESGNDEPTSWVRMKESILRHLEIAARLGSPSIRIFGGNPKSCKNPKEYIAKTADVIAEVLQKDDSGVAILIQNHEGSYSVEHSLDLINLTGNDRFGLLYSPEHCIITGESLDDLYPSIKKVTKQIYYADILKIQDGYKYTLPGKGCIFLKESLDALGGKDYDGWITLKWEKIWNPELEEPEIALPYFIEYCKSIGLK